jgi:hypothetical protein
MQNVTCFEWIRLSRRAVSLFAFLACCGIGLIAASATCVAQDTPESGTRSNEPKATAVFIVDEKECAAKVVGAWSETERWAWEQICKHLNVDFDEKEANDVVDDKVGRDSPRHDQLYQQTIAQIRARNTKTPGMLAADRSRRLSGDFLARIFGDPELTSHTWNVPLKFVGFNTDRFVVDTATLKSLDIRDASIGSFVIHNTTIDGGVRLENVRLASMSMQLVTAKNVLLSKLSVAAANAGLNQLGHGQRSLREEEPNGELRIDTVRIEDRLAIVEGKYDAIDLQHVKVDDLFIDHPDWNSTREDNKAELSITETVASGVFTIQVAPEHSPGRINLDQFIFANAYLGRDPMPVITALDANAKTADRRPDLEPYTLIAKSYAERGETSISDRVLIQKNYQDWRLADRWTLDFAWLTFTRFVAVYGFHPELGFVWIGGFVVLGWVIFWSASGHLAPDSYRPKSPLLLALDSVIPGIQLDKNNLDVRYHGWPQMMLYLLRMLGAVLVFVAFSYLHKRLLG